MEKTFIMDIITYIIQNISLITVLLRFLFISYLFMFESLFTDMFYVFS
jgi:hypothetical protein